MSTLDIELPIRLDFIEDESFNSFAIRVLTENGLSLEWLKRLIGIAYNETVGAEHAGRLSALLEAPVSALESALPRKFHKQWRAVSYCGFQLLAYNHLRMRKPQICPACLHHKGYCRRIWDLSLSTICLEHRTKLIDRCGACARPLRWERKSIDVCDCGEFLCGEVGMDTPTFDRLAVLQELIESRFSEIVTDSQNSKIRLPGFLHHLSMDGLLFMVHIFGVLPAAMAVIPQAVRHRILTSEQWRAIGVRAVERLEQFASSDFDSRKLEHLLPEALLKRQVVTYVDRSDSSAANAVLQEVFGYQLHGHMSGKNPELSQLHLL